MSRKTITIAVYPDGLLITIDGKSYVKDMSNKQKLFMARELIGRVISDAGEECRELGTLPHGNSHTQSAVKSESISQPQPSYSKAGALLWRLRTMLTSWYGTKRQGKGS